jgi:hypothetical protein
LLVKSAPRGRPRWPAGVEPGARGEILVKPVRAERLPDLCDKLGFPLLLQRPRPQADALAQALGRPRQPRGPVPVALDERQLGERGQAQGHVTGAVGRQAQLQPFVKERPGLLGPAPIPVGNPAWKAAR